VAERVIAGELSANAAAIEAGVRKPDMRYTADGILLPDLGDGRSRLARRYRRLCQELAEEVGGALTASERALIAQAAWLILQAEANTTAANVAGENIGKDDSIRRASESRRLIELVMKGRKAGKSKPPGDAELKAYLNEHYRQPAETGGAA
jgi:hypothetical protein